MNEEGSYEALTREQEASAKLARDIASGMPHPRMSADGNIHTSDGTALATATLVRSFARCTRRQVGAVVFNSLGWEIGRGWNGAPYGKPGCLEGACPRGRLTYEQQPADVGYGEGEGRCIALHAEWRAMLDTNSRSRVGGLMAVTDKPCTYCMAFLYESGLSRVIWLGGGEEILR